MLKIDLSELTGNGTVRNLAGHERGAEARKRFRLADADDRGEKVLVVVPEDVYTINGSFFQGMFAESVRKLGSRDAFLDRYSFNAAPIVLRQIDNGVEKSLMKRQSIFA